MNSFVSSITGSAIFLYNYVCMLVGASFLSATCMHIVPLLTGKALEMSFDHKPTDPPELERIAKAGGQVGIDGRVNGGLNLTRAIGIHYICCNAILLLCFVV